MIEGRIPTRIVLDRMGVVLGIKPREDPLALRIVFRQLTSTDFRHPQTGLIMRSKALPFAEALMKMDELSPYLKDKSAEVLHDEMLRWQVVSPLEKEEIEAPADVGVLRLLLETEDADAKNMIHSAIIVVAGKKLAEAQTPEDVIQILNFYQRYLPHVVDEMGINCGIFFEILVDMAEAAKERIETRVEADLKEKFGIKMTTLDLLRTFLAESSATGGGINRVAYFDRLARGIMAIGSTNSQEHRNKLENIAHIPREQLGEIGGTYNPEEDRPLNDLVGSISLPMIVPDYPILVEAGKVYRMLEWGEKVEIECNLLEDFSNYPIYQLVRELGEGMKFDGKAVEDFVIVPVKNGEKLGFIFMDNAYDRRQSKTEDIFKIVKMADYASQIVDASQKRTRREIDSRIREKFEFYLNELRRSIKDRQLLKQEFLDFYRAEIHKKEGATGYKSIISVERMIKESFNMLLPKGITFNTRIFADIPDVYCDIADLQGALDGMVINALLTLESEGKFEQYKHYQIDFRVEREGNRLVLKQTNNGVNPDAQALADRKKYDLGATLADFAANADLSSQPNHYVRGAVGFSSNPAGLWVTIDEVVFVP